MDKDQISRGDLVSYLNALRDSVLHASTLFFQINSIIEWSKKDIKDEADINGQFFEYVFYTFHRVLVLECYKLLWHKEYMNLTQFLNFLSKNYDIVKPFRNEALVAKDVYINEIREQKRQLRELKPVIDNIRELRNNLYAHSDETYYHDHGKLGTDFPVSWNDINHVLDVLKSIVKSQYGFIKQADVDLEQIYSSQNVTLYLKRSLGFQRFWKNKNLNNLKKFAFLKEDYDPDDIYLQGEH